LKGIQVLYLIKYRLVRKILTKNIKLKKISKFNIASINWKQYFFSSYRNFEKVNDSIVFSALNKKVVFNSSLWLNKEGDPLFNYQLHYFNDLPYISTHNPSLFKELTEKYNQLLTTNRFIGLEPYPTSLRIVNIIKSIWLNHDLISNELNKYLYFQVLVLENNIEVHIQANHLFENGKALIFAGIYFQNDGDRFLNKGLKLISKELKKQFYNDGGHFELSPMYHCRMMENIIDLIQLSQKSKSNKLNQIKTKLLETCQKGITWLEYLSHPNGEVSFFNDSSLNIYPNLENLKAYAKKACNIDFRPFTLPRVVHLEESGFIVFSTDRVKLILKYINNSSAFQPGHTHADELSFELSVDGKKAITNPGVSSYHDNFIRMKERSSRYKNTCHIEGSDHSEVWSKFRLGRRSSLKSLEIQGDKVSIGLKNYQGDLIYRTIEITDTNINVADTANKELISVINTVSNIVKVHSKSKYQKKDIRIPISFNASTKAVSYQLSGKSNTFNVSYLGNKNENS